MTSFETLWENLIAFLPVLLARIAISAVYIVITAVIIKLIFRFFDGLEKRSEKFTPIISQLSKKVVKVTFWGLCVIGVLQTFGINLTPIIAGLGITGVVLGFALQESISSFFSGVMIAINNPFRLGDYVEVGGIGGTVVSIDLMCVTLSTPDNKRITMNNKTVWGSTIINYSYIKNRRIDMTLSVAYDSDLDLVKKVCKEVLATYPEILKTPEPVVEVSSLGASSIDFVVRPWVIPGDYWKVYWRFQKDIVEACRKNGIEIPFNKLDVTIMNNAPEEKT